MSLSFVAISFFFFNDTATTEIYTLSLHDALPILTLPARRGEVAEFELTSCVPPDLGVRATVSAGTYLRGLARDLGEALGRSEEHTSELQSLAYLVCRLLLEKKKTIKRTSHAPHNV